MENLILFLFYQYYVSLFHYRFVFYNRFTTLKGSAFGSSLASGTGHVFVNGLAGSTRCSLIRSLVGLGLLGAVLDLTESSLTGRLALFGLLGLLLGKHLHGGTTDSAVGNLEGGPLLLTSGSSLLILAVDLAVHYGPGKLGWPLALVEHSLGLLIEEQELLAIYADEQNTPAGVDLQAAKAAGLGPAR